MSHVQTVAFFGGTGGCAGYCLAAALTAGLHCIALARTPSKLTTSIQAKGVNAEIVDRQLTIVQGDIRDVEAVKRTIVYNGRVVDIIVSGLGGTPELRLNWYPVGLSDPTICQDGVATIIKAAVLACRDANEPRKPILINVSTTGIWQPGEPWDIPLAYYAFYRWLLHVPHEDKRVMEELLRDHAKLPEAEKGLHAFVLVKPTLLMDGPGNGVQAIREGTEDKPAIGFTITRSDVGKWMYERLIKEMSPEWHNRSISLTY